MRNTQFSHIFSNWNALPKSRKKRVLWLKNTARTALARSKSMARSVAGRQTVVDGGTVVEVEASSAQPTKEVLNETPPDPVGSPWEVDGRALLFSGPEQDSTAMNCAQSVDHQTRLGEKGSLRLEVDGRATALVRINEPLQNIRRLRGLTGFGVSLFTPDPGAIEDFGLWVFASNGGRYRWSSANAAPARLRAGWNHLRFSPTSMRPPLEHPDWGDVAAVQFYVQTRGSTSFNLGSIWGETRPKASLLFIHDGGYLNFDQSPGYSDLADRDIPVTWAVDCALIGDETHVTRDRLIEVGNENSNSISFHGWDGAISNKYTSGEQARDETLKAQKWIKDLPTKGNTGWKWRTAWMQNRSPHSPATNDLVRANPMWDPNNRPPVGVGMWPLMHPYNYRRQALHHLSKRTLNELFEEAKETHGVLICYTHNVGEGSNNISPELWEQFLDLVDEGVREGWLEGVTFEMLEERDTTRVTP